jgi:hypothetical protein
MVELRTKYEIAKEIFGGPFSFRWFIPFGIGGYFNVYKALANTRDSKLD